MAQILLDTEHARVFDLIETLGYQINDMVELPQIVVCGDQSAGKSSLLQSISGIKLPTATGQCTLFPTRLVLQRSTRESINVSIHPSENCSDELRKSMEAFSCTPSRVDDLRDVVDLAKVVMGLDDDSITDHVLNIEIYGPRCPHLTLVDLPGLISVVTGVDSKRQITVIDNLVQSYLRRERTIILAVVSAAMDFQRQPVLNMVKEHDPKGQRTLGIITKPDRQTGPRAQDGVIRGAKNQFQELELGWHIVKNLDNDVPKGLSKLEIVDEASFFSTSPWSTLPNSQLGIESLVERLSKQLGFRIAKQIPKIISEIETKLSDCNSTLQALGSTRKTEESQREHLTKLATRFQVLVKDSLEARYRDSIFDRESLRLRSRVSDVQHSLLYNLTCYGPTYDIHCENQPHQPSHSRWSLDRSHVESHRQKLKDASGDQNFLLTPRSLKKMTCKEHANHVYQTIVTRNRGPYQPSLIDPSLIGIVFRDLTRNWDEIVRQHLNYAHRLVTDFVSDVFRRISDEHVYASLNQEILSPKIELMRVNLRNKVTECLSPYKDGNPVSWRPALISDLVSLVNQHRVPEEMSDPIGAADWMASVRLCHEAYSFYNHSQYTMLDTIGALAIERCLFRDLEDLFTAPEVSKMSTATLERLAGEPLELREKRRHTLEKKERLEKALAECHRFEIVLPKRSCSPSAARSDIPNIAINRAMPQTEGPVFGKPSSVVNSDIIPIVHEPTPPITPDKRRDDSLVDDTIPPPLTPPRSRSPSPVKVETPLSTGIFTPTKTRMRKPSSSRSPRYRAPQVVEVGEGQDL